MTLNDLQTDIDDWVRTYGVRYFSELTNLGILMEEVGEVARIMTRRYRGTRASRAPRKTTWATSWPTSFSC
jgi:NTP pyrophosphatase (non-canonical NTP hydrolase)